MRKIDIREQTNLLRNSLTRSRTQALLGSGLFSDVPKGAEPAMYGVLGIVLFVLGAEIGLIEREKPPPAFFDRLKFSKTAIGLSQMFPNLDPDQTVKFMKIMTSIIDLLLIANGVAFLAKKDYPNAILNLAPPAANVAGYLLGRYG